MPRQIRSRLAVVAPLVAAMFSAPACVDILGAGVGQYVEQEEKRFPAVGTPDIDLTTFDGAIEIRPWDRDEVLVVVEKRGFDESAVDAIRVTGTQIGSRITVEARLPEGSPHWNLSWGDGRPGARLIASVPARSNVAARSGDGSIDVEGITGTLELRSGDGRIRARSIAGELRVHTGDGSITLEDVDGSLDLETGDGAVVAAGRVTALRARTGDGSVTVHAADGSIAATDWSITSGDGSVTLELPDGFSGELDAHTGDGRIRLNDVAVSNHSRDGDRTTLRGTLGSGGRTVRVRTGDGSITLRKF